ncbi:MAG: O-antigen ligase family protein, partial [Candidatus Izemoplasmataceae bacterium]
WDAFKHYLGLHSTGIQMMILVPVVAFGVLHNRRHIISNSFKNPLVIWFFWILYSLINTYIINDISILPKNAFVLASAIIISFLFVLFISSRHLKTYDLLNLLIIAYFGRLMLSLMFDSGGFIGSMTRFGEEFNANTIAFGALFIVVIIAIKKIQFARISYLDVVFLTIAILTVVATGSRKNLILLIFLSVSYMYINRSKDIIKNIIKLSLFGILIAITTIWILNNTYVGERTLGLYERTVQARDLGAPEKMFDHRARYYIDGWRLFKNYPVNGVGLTNFAHYDRFSRSLHSEYMAQITEGGIIGTFIFIMFYLFILLKLYSIRNKDINNKKTAEIYIASVLIMLFLFTGAWIYRYPVMWVLIALSVRFIYVIEHNRKSNHINQSYSAS